MSGRAYRAGIWAVFALTISLAGAIFSTEAARAEAPALPATSDPSARGLAIAQENDKRDRGWGDAKADMKMILTNSSGETSERALRFLMLETAGEDDGNWSLMTFDKPADIEGTALLTYPHIKEADEQWLYLPTVKRVKRISSANKSGPFVGSEFAFEDFSTQQVAKFSYKWLKDEPCGTLTCHVVERTPQYEDSGYTREIVWVDTTDYQFRKIDYYDRKNSLLKTLTYNDYKLYEGKFWRPAELDMVNHETNKTTRLIWQGYSFHTGLTKDDFTTASLERAR
ncbi:outer membrane lipoprotein-sorting protein [Parvibaculum sp.]|uniref:outer membrane lipoprotein-sorting protein n=1 Tax=Parvibaculum sp. TaxID=2024848 RepID=UPI002BD01F56|nr:outer membrane lipoprotein-sorting protein [Parvibaculum sp.]HUD52876.1 outer membrane lipoprotein-sorting protein [Parvibaculum sp.]